MQLTEISFNELSKHVGQFQFINKGKSPSFVIVSPQAYWAMYEELYPTMTDRIKIKVRGVPVISSNELELGQVEIVQSIESV
jgi:hypothetical protein